MTDRGLRKLGIHAVAAFNREIAAGEREDVKRDEYDVDALMAVGEADGEDTGADAAAADGTSNPPFNKQKKKKSKFFSSSKSKAIVKQAKIARATDRLDPLSPHVGVGRSNGFGFLEMERHSDALKVLRWANNRPGVTDALLWGWWRDELREIVARAKAEPLGAKQQEKTRAGQGTDAHPAVTEADAWKTKLQLWERTLKEMEDQGAGAVKTKLLLVEFSIENKHVLKMRADKMVRARLSQTPPIVPSAPGVQISGFIITDWPAPFSETVTGAEGGRVQAGRTGCEEAAEGGWRPR